MNKTKKTAGQCNRKKKVYERVLAYMENEVKTVQEYNQTLEEYLLSNDLSVCFNHLHNFIDKTMIDEQRRNILLEDGVYILLEGNVTFTWTKNRHDRDRKDHLFSLAKTGVFSNLSQSSPDRQNILSSGYSISISTSFAVIESQCGNINTNDDCIFLKIPTRVLELTDFYKIKAERIDIFSKAKLPGVRNFSSEALIALNFGLHHTFKARKMFFRNKFEISSLGIIVNGSASVKAGMNLKKKSQFTQFCILLPNFQYDVSSAQIQIIQVIKNPTIIFKRPIIINKFIEEINRFSQHDENEQKNSLVKYRKKIAASVSMHKQKQQKISRSKQQRKKKKQFSLFSKQCENFCIIPMQFCKQNLTHIRSVKKKAQIQQKNKKPRILFNFSKKQLLSNKQWQNPMGESLFSKINGNIAMGKSQLMERYEVYAKDIYEEFKRHKQKKNYSSLVLPTSNNN